MPPAARRTDIHACPIPGHGPNPLGTPCCPTVVIGLQIAARVTDRSACGGPVAMGSPTVLIGNLMAARLGDPTGHGGRIVTGFPTVLIGDAPKAAAPPAPP
jgi:uncharacterized Zn-binding protein involved in type VI secretion